MCPRQWQNVQVHDVVNISLLYHSYEHQDPASWCAPVQGLYQFQLASNWGLHWYYSLWSSFSRHTPHSTPILINTITVLSCDAMFSSNEHVPTVGELVYDVESILVNTLVGGCAFFSSSVWIMSGGSTVSYTSWNQCVEADNMTAMWNHTWYTVLQTIDNGSYVLAKCCRR